MTRHVSGLFFLSYKVALSPAPYVTYRYSDSSNCPTRILFGTVTIQNNSQGCFTFTKGAANIKLWTSAGSQEIVVDSVNYQPGSSLDLRPTIAATSEQKVLSVYSDAPYIFIHYTNSSVIQSGEVCLNGISGESNKTGYINAWNNISTPQRLGKFSDGENWNLYGYSTYQICP